MGFLKKLKKGLSKVVKKAMPLVMKAAPIAANFIPGGGFGMTLLKAGIKTFASKAPATRNRFPMPNPFMGNFHPTAAMAVRQKRAMPRATHAAYSRYNFARGRAMRMTKRQAGGMRRIFGRRQVA